MKYDYLLVGAGLFSAVFATELRKSKKTYLVIDRRCHIGGNLYTEEREKIHVHKYGAHIFHTSDKVVWDYVNKFAEFLPYVHSPIAKYQDEIYNLPFNMNTFAQMWGISTAEEAKSIIAKDVEESAVVNPQNLEEQAIALVGVDIYQKLIRGYTEKQWGKPCAELPAFIINRLPLRFTYDNNYFSDKYQGIPKGGYTKWLSSMFENSEILLNTEYKTFVAEHPDIAEKTLYTGSVDQLLDYELGPLAYRSLRFQEELSTSATVQGTAVVNYTHKDVPYTRVIEHKYFEDLGSKQSILSYEYPVDWTLGMEAYYPINDAENQKKYLQYCALLREKYPHILLGGRLGLYAYLDMDKVVKMALELVERELA